MDWKTVFQLGKLCGTSGEVSKIIWRRQSSMKKWSVFFIKSFTATPTSKFRELHESRRRSSNSPYRNEVMLMKACKSMGIA
jgi:hypothetical protein